MNLRYSLLYFCFYCISGASDGMNLCKLFCLRIISHMRTLRFTWSVQQNSRKCHKRMTCCLRRTQVVLMHIQLFQIMLFQNQINVPESFLSQVTCILRCLSMSGFTAESRHAFSLFWNFRWKSATLVNVSLEGVSIGNLDGNTTL